MVIATNDTVIAIIDTVIAISGTFKGPIDYMNYIRQLSLRASTLALHGTKYIIDNKLLFSIKRKRIH
jgi:hypothetical protein